MRRIDMHICGVYRVSCKANSRYYIGSAQSVILRIGQHIQLLKGDRHPNKEMQFDWNQFGEFAFNFHLVEACETRRDAFDLERIMLAKARKSLLYNIIRDYDKEAAERDHRFFEVFGVKRIRAVPKTKTKSKQEEGQNS